MELLREIERRTIMHAMGLNYTAVQFYIPVDLTSTSISRKQSIDDVITPGKLKLPPTGLTGLTNISRKPFMTKVIIDGYKDRGCKCIPVDVRLLNNPFPEHSKAKTNRIDIEDLEDPTFQVLHLNWARGPLLDHISRRWTEILKEAGAPTEPTFQWGSFITWRPDLLDVLMADDLFSCIGALGYSAYDPVANEVIPLLTIYDPDLIVDARPLRSGISVDLPERLFA